MMHTHIYISSISAIFVTKTLSQTINQTYSNWPHGKEHIKQHCVIKMKKKYHTVETVSY